VLPVCTAAAAGGCGPTAAERDSAISNPATRIAKSNAYQSNEWDAAVWVFIENFPFFGHLDLPNTTKQNPRGAGLIWVNKRPAKPQL